MALALEVFCEALDLAARPKLNLHPNPEVSSPPTRRLQKVLQEHAVPEALDLLLRVVTYTDRFLHALAGDRNDPERRHPAFVMDLNMLLKTVAALTRYAPDVPSLKGTATALASVPRQNAADWDMLFLVRAVAGDPATWYPRNPYSEFHMLRPIATRGSANKFQDGGRNEAELVKYLRWVWAGACDCGVDALNDWQAAAWRDEDLNPNRKEPPRGSVADNEAGEIWFYINGIVTDHWIAQLNAEYLAELFRRPINILHNPTDGLHRDLVKCVRGRTMQDTTEVAKRLIREMEKHLARGLGKKKIVVIAHSQGTIITTEIVKRLAVEHRSILKKMEVFNFAFCADDFPEDTVGYVEHFINENDFVPRLSIVPGQVPYSPYDAPGCIYRNAGAWGHLLNAHYLEPFAKGHYRDARGGKRSVLYQYLDGHNYGVPARALKEPCQPQPPLKRLSAKAGR